MVGHDSHEQQQYYGAVEISGVHSDAVALELDRLKNQLKEKERELGVVRSEIKSVRATKAQKDKAVEELHNHVHKLDEKLRINQSIVENKNLEIRKLATEKKDALAAQFAAEAALRRLHTNVRDDETIPLGSIIAPLESEIKMYRNEVSALQEDKKALERLTKSKESALIEAERIISSALERALIVEEVQNQNFELRRQIEICQEENRILEKTNRQQVLKVEKLSQTIHELEEVVLAAGATANAVRDHRRKIDELNEEKRTLERELARAKVTANRVATSVANEWKDENDTVMPVKQWLEERRVMQAEMQRLREKLSASERTATAEAQLKEKLKLRLKTLEEGLRQVSGVSPKSGGNFLGFLTSSAGLRKRSTSQPRASMAAKSSSPPQHPNSAKKGLWTSRNKIIHIGEKENGDMRNASVEPKGDELVKEAAVNPDNGDMVSGYLYDRLQKEVISLRRAMEAKENNLSEKDHEIGILMKKVETQTKAMETEMKRVKREITAREKEALSKTDCNRKNRVVAGSPCKRLTK